MYNQLLDVVICINKIVYADDEGKRPHSQSLVYRYDVEEKDLDVFINACSRSAVHGEMLVAYEPPEKRWYQFWRR